MGGGSRDYTEPAKPYDWSDSATKKTAADYAKDDKRGDFGGFSSNGIAPPVGKDIAAAGSIPMVLIMDVTGSMREWPGLVFKKISTLYKECNLVLQGLELSDVKEKKKSVEDLLEVAVIAVGDAKGDGHPLQVVDFSKGPDLVNRVDKIFPEGGGGGNLKESYDLGVYYALNHCKTPEVPEGIKPLLIIAGDEGFYTKVSPQEVKKLIGDDIGEPLDATEMMRELNDRFDVYMLRPEEHYSAEQYAQVRKQWGSVFVSEKIIKMGDPERLVDDVIAVCGYHMGNIEGGIELIKRRQSAEQVAQVLEDIHPLLDADQAKPKKKAALKKEAK